MTLTAPKQVTFWIAVAIAVLGAVAKVVAIPVLSGYPGWIMLLAFLVLALGVVVKDL